MGKYARCLFIHIKLKEPYNFKKASAVAWGMSLEMDRSADSGCLTAKAWERLDDIEWRTIEKSVGELNFGEFSWLFHEEEDNENICYIHGNADNNDEIFFGHGNNRQYDDYEGQEDINSISVAELYSQLNDVLRKPVIQIIRQRELFSSLFIA